MKLSFKSSNEFRANTEPRARPGSSQVNQRTEPRFEPSWDSSKAEPVSKPKPRLTIERAQYCALDSAKTSRVDIDLIPAPGRVRTNPSRIQSPELSLEPSPEPRPSLAKLRVPRRASELSRAVKHQTDPRAEMPIRASNKAEPSTEPRTWFDQV